MKEFTLDANCVVEGIVEGEALVTQDCISFMGTVNPNTGYIIERKHDIEGECIKDKILVFPSAKGSTGGAYMLYEAASNHVGPKAIINRTIDSVVVIGCIVADIPMVVGADISQIHTGDYIYLNATEGTIRVVRKDS